MARSRQSPRTHGGQTGRARSPEDARLEGSLAPARRGGGARDLWHSGVPPHPLGSTRIDHGQTHRAPARPRGLLPRAGGGPRRSPETRKPGGAQGGARTSRSKGPQPPLGRGDRPRRIGRRPAATGGDPHSSEAFGVDRKSVVEG